MFRALISPIFSSLLPGYRPVTSWLHYTTSRKHSLEFLKMGEIIA
jgi:hypothetical protein